MAMNHGSDSAGGHQPMQVDTSGRQNVNTSLLKFVQSTAVADTSAHANGEVLTDPVTIAGALREAGRPARLRSLTVVDGDDQTAYSFDVLFFKASQSLGTKNA